MSVRIAVFASGGGSNLQALLDRFADAAAPADIVLVVSDRPGTPALERGRRAGVRAAVVGVAGRTEEDIAAETLALLDEAQIDLIALAGYLRLVPRDVVRRYAGRIVNVHPALLPAFGGRGMYGLRVHRAVLDSGCLVTGVTVHLVTENYDEGVAIAQWPVPVHERDTPETLGARVLAAEHVLYPLAVESLARSIAGATGGAPRAPASFAAGAALAPAEADALALVRIRAPRNAT